MIEPVLTGAALVDEIIHTDVAPGSVGVWRLGQAGMVVAFPHARILIDPYLSNHCEAVLGAPFDHRRLTRSPLDPAEIDFIDVVLCSHDHLDHLDPPTIRTLARTNPGADIVVPASAASAVEQLGWKHAGIRPAAAGEQIGSGGLTISGIAVPHDDFDHDPVLGYPYLGYAISDGHSTVVHMGDARSHPDVIDQLRDRAIDVLAVPINGRDRTRAAMGFAGNMNALEAVSFSHAVSADCTIPMHYDMFAQNVDDGALDEFVAHATEGEVAHIMLNVGERYLHTRK